MKSIQTRPSHAWPQPHPCDEQVAVEEPLEIRVEGISMAITMRTPGEDLDLAAGLLFSEGIIEHRDDLRAMGHIDTPSDGEKNIIDVRLATGMEQALQAVQEASRSFYATSSCGICGKASLERIRVTSPPLDRCATVAPDVLCRLPQALKATQHGFHATGGLHGAALFTLDGTLRVAREDIGRHNAVDKVIGWALHQEDVVLEEHILVVSSRAGFEIVHKARIARIPIIAALGAASSLAIDLANDGHQVLIGWLKEHRYTTYT